MFQDSIPVSCVEDLWNSVIDGVGTFRDRVKDHVPSKSYSDLLEDKGTLCNHQHRHLLHLIHSALPHALLSLSVLTDHCHLSILLLEVGLETHIVEVAWH